MQVSSLERTIFYASTPNIFSQFFFFFVIKPREFLDYDKSSPKATLLYLKYEVSVI